MKSRFCLVLLSGFSVGAIAAPLVVISTNDSGIGTLRQAIVNANFLLGEDTIQFNIPGAGPHRIEPLSPLPDIQDPVVIDGTTQPGFAGSPLIELHGGGRDFSGLMLAAGGCTIRGLVINGFGDNGIYVQSARNRIEGNWIGTDVTGTQAVGNGFHGIFVFSDRNSIGGPTAAARNILSGNVGNGILLFGNNSYSNVVQGNFIGTDVTGTRALGNGGSGVGIQQLATRNIIGGALADAGNLISGNGIAAEDPLLFRRSGVRLSGSDNVVQGNRIGTDFTGENPLPNQEHGIHLIGQLTDRNIIGGLGTAANLISGNTWSGIFMHLDCTENRVEGNSIIRNGENGVHILDCAGNFIGSADPAVKCVISGNDRRGILIESGIDAGTAGTRIRNCLIGTDAQGLGAYANGSAGIHLRNGASDIEIGPGNVISGNQGSGVMSEGVDSRGHTIRGNFIGTDARGANVLPNGGHGVHFAGSGTNVVGGVDSADRNVISGNQRNGIFVDGSEARRNSIQGNLIGTDATGAVALGNGENGVHVLEANETSLLRGNVISANRAHGIYLEGGIPPGTTISGSLIGADSSGIHPLGNAQSGIDINGASGVSVGGPGAGRNVIAYNGWQGVHVRNGVRNRVRNNSIFGNGFLGVSLGDDDILPNDSGDSDQGANNLQNYPVLTSATYANGQTTVQGTLNSTPKANFNIELFVNDACDSSGYGEGQSILAIQAVSTDASGNASFTAVFTQVALGQHITALATDAQNSTSEFSRCLQVTVPELGFELSDHQLTLSWPNDPSLKLQCTTNLYPPIVWGPVTNEVTVVANEMHVTVDTSVGTKFFRLSN